MIHLCLFIRVLILSFPDPPEARVRVWAPGLGSVIYCSTHFLLHVFAKTEMRRLVLGVGCCLALGTLSLYLAGVWLSRRIGDE